MELIKTKTILRRKKGAPVTVRTAGDGGGYSSGDTGYAERAAYAEAAGMIRGMNDVLYPVDSAGNRVEWYSPEIHAIKAVKTLFSAQGVSARGLSETQAGGGTGGSSTLGGLTDVTLGPLKSGDALIYDGTKWTNQPVKVGIDETALATYLSANRYAKLSDIPSLDGCVQKSGDTMSGLLKISSAGWGQQLTVHRTNGTASIYFHNGETEAGYIYFENNKNFYVGGTGIKVGIGTQYDVWHAGNDGAGSGLDADMLDGLHSSEFNRCASPSWTNGETVQAWAKRLGWANPTLYNETYWEWASSKLLTIGSYTIDSQRYSALDFRRGNLNEAWEQKAIMFLPTYGDSEMIYIAQMSASGTGGEVTLNAVRRYATYDTILASNVASATRLQGTYSLWGQSFYGNNVSGDMSDVGLITFANGQKIYCPSGEFALNLNSYTRLLTGNATGVAIGYGSPRYKLDVRGSLIADGWLRTTGAAGWYSEDYGGGWYMQGGTYIENYGAKRVKLTGAQSYYDLCLAGGGICCEGNAGWGWNAGYGCINAGIADNSAQTPLIVAYRNGSAFQNCEPGRLFSMELLNDGSQVWLNFGGTNRFKFWSTGELYAQAGVWSNGYISARGQNTGSDIRLKDILGDCPLTVEQVAELPAVRFRWKDNGTVAVGTIAQEVRKVLPEIVRERPQDGMLSLDYGDLGWLAAHAVAVRVTEHESRLDRIERLLGITE